MRAGTSAGAVDLAAAASGSDAAKPACSQPLAGIRHADQPARSGPLHRDRAGDIACLVAEAGQPVSFHGFVCVVRGVKMTPAAGFGSTALSRTASSAMQPLAPQHMTGTGALKDL